MSQPLPPAFHRAVLSLDDFGRAAEFAKSAASHDAGSIEYEALLHSAIVFYARPFTNNEGQKSELPKDARTLTGIDPAAILGSDFEFHKRLLLLRNKMIAHAEAEFFPAQYGGPMGDAGKRGFTTSQQLWRIANEQLDTNLIESVATRMKGAATNLAFATAERLGLIQEVPPMGPPVQPSDPKA